MRLTIAPRAALLTAALLLCGCITHKRYALEGVPLPNNAIPLGGMMRELSTVPGFSGQVIEKLSKGEKSGMPLSPALLRLLRAMVLGRQWQRLDAFPGLTAHELALSANEADRLATRYFPEKRSRLAQFLDTGEYGFDANSAVNLDRPAPANLQGVTGTAPVDFGNGVTAGDGPDPRLYPMHARSLQLAFVLNRLAVNPATGLADSTLTATANGQQATRPEDVIRALQNSGHTVTVRDRRYFANFGHLHYHGRDVMMPFWINAQVWVPGTLHRLRVPVSHTELEYTIAGPSVNAVLAFYYGVEGKAEFRTTDMLNQAWVMGVTRHTWSGADAVEITRLLGEEIAAYERVHVAHPELPIGGYYKLGVCQDSIAIVEEKMTGTTSMFPLTADPSYFSDPRSAEIAALLRRLPNDRRGLPSLDRLLNTLPVDDVSQLPTPALRSDVARVQGAQEAGRRLRRHSPYGLAAILLLVLVAVTVWRRERREHPARPA